MVEVFYHPVCYEYTFKVFVDKGVEFPSYSYLADVANSYDVDVFGEGITREFAVHRFTVNCANTNN